MEATDSARVDPAEVVVLDPGDVQQTSYTYSSRLSELDEGAEMLPSVRPFRRIVSASIAVAGAMWFGAAAIAAAEPPPVPPPCSAAEMARVISGVTFDTSNYLATHPPVNDFFTSLKGQPKDQIADQVRTYLDANPSVRDELQRLRQPSVDFRNRCGLPPTP